MAFSLALISMEDPRIDQGPVFTGEVVDAGLDNRPGVILVAFQGPDRGRADQSDPSSGTPWRPGVAAPTLAARLAPAAACRSCARHYVDNLSTGTLGPAAAVGAATASPRGPRTSMGDAPGLASGERLG